MVVSNYTIAQPTPPRCLTAALDYLDRGWSVIPLCAPDHYRASTTHSSICTSPGKAPIWKWSRNQHQLASENELRLAWQDNSHLNVGVVMGQISGLVGIDIDGFAGSMLLEELSGGDLPSTVTFNTGGCEDPQTGVTQERYRLLYSVPKTHVCKTTGFQVDGREVMKILGNGSQTVMPPSIHRNGNQYSWQAMRSPAEIDVAPAPQWLLAQLVAPHHESLVHYQSNTPPPTPGQVTNDPQWIIPEGARDNTLAAFAGTLRRHGCGMEELLAALLTINTVRCRPPLNETQVRKIANSIMRYAPTQLPKFETCVAYGPTAGTYGPDRVNMPDVEVKPIHWLWQDWLPVGKLVAFDGDGGSGKSTALIDLAARVTRGDRMPDGSAGWHEPADIVLISLEDDLEDTLKPKLLIAEADLARVHAFTKVVDDKGEVSPFMLPTHIAALAQLIEQRRAKLCIIDPLLGVWAGGDYFKTTEVRKAMEELRDLARDKECCVIFVRHFTKGSAGKGQASYRSEGSIAFNAAARVVLNCGQHPDDKTKSVLSCAKNNIARKPPSIVYELVPRNGYCKISWQSQTELTADDMASEDLSTPEGRSQLAQAKQITRDICFATENPTPGQATVEEINRVLRAEGISERTGARAAQQMGMITRNIHGVRYRMFDDSHTA